MSFVNSAGKAECIWPPYGKHGLEGYNRGAVYPFRRMANDDIGVHPCSEQDVLISGDAAPDYYECCTEAAFLAHFRIVCEYSVEAISKDAALADLPYPELGATHKEA